MLFAHINDKQYLLRCLPKVLSSEDSKIIQNRKSV